MKKHFLIALFAALCCFSACKKDEDSEPVLAVVGTWTVQTQLLNTNTGLPYGNWGLSPTFELELTPNETGWKRGFMEEKALEWDLVNGDKTIVLTGRGLTYSLFSGDSTIQAVVLDIVAQTDQSAEWISNTGFSIQDTVTNELTPYREHWFLQRK